MADSASVRDNRTHRPFGWWVVLALLFAALIGSQCSAPDDADPASVDGEDSVDPDDGSVTEAGEPGDSPESPSADDDSPQQQGAPADGSNTDSDPNNATTHDGETSEDRDGTQAGAAGRSDAFLQQVGTELVDGNGDSVTLRGINLGGWLMWEGWLWGGWGTPTKVNSETYLLQRLTDEVGAESAERFRQQIYDNFITEADIRRISELGFNMVRVPINHRAIEDPDRPGRLDSAGIARIDRLIDWGETHRVYVILDLHSTPGGQSVLFTADPDDTKLWDAPAKQDRTISLWSALAARYADEPWVAGYDLINEPMVLTPSKLTSLYNRIIEAIRVEDPDHIVFVEGNWFGHVLTDLGDALIDDDNLVYSFHAYEFSNRDLAADLADHVAFARERDRPLYAGEYGHDSAEVVASQTTQYRATPEVVAWSSWTWKRTAIADHPVIQEIQHPDSWHQVIAAITAGRSIEEFDVQTAMDDFVESIRLANCVEDREIAAVS